MVRQKKVPPYFKSFLFILMSLYLTTACTGFDSNQPLGESLTSASTDPTEKNPVIPQQPQPPSPPSQTNPPEPVVSNPPPSPSPQKSPPDPVSSYPPPPPSITPPVIGPTHPSVPVVEPLGPTVIDYSNPKIQPISLPQKNTAPHWTITDQFLPKTYDKFTLITRHLGYNCNKQTPPAGVDCNEIYANKNPVTWDVGTLTGFQPPAPVSNWQLGYHNLGLPSGSSAFQMHDYDVGSFINTWSFNHTQPVIGGGPHTVYQINYSSPKSPWRTPTSELTLQAHIQIPWVVTWKGGVGQFSFFFYLKDIKSNIIFPYVLAIFDTRPAGVDNGKEFLSHDTFHPFVSTPIKAGTRYATKSPFSESFVGKNACICCLVGFGARFLFFPARVGFL